MSLTAFGAGMSPEDRLQVEDLLARYWETVDAGATEEFAGTFTADGSLENYTGVTAGREALAQWLADYEPSRAGNRHYSVNTRVTPTGPDSATVWSYMVVLAVAAPRTNTPHVIAYARFDDEVVRVDGEWLFKSRVMTETSLNAADYPEYSGQNAN